MDKDWITTIVFSNHPSKEWNATIMFNNRPRLVYLWDQVNM